MSVTPVASCRGRLKIETPIHSLLSACPRPTDGKPIGRRGKCPFSLFGQAGKPQTLCYEPLAVQRSSVTRFVISNLLPAA